MPTIGILTSFSDFIKDHYVEIPRIQRDYTYGSGTPKTEEVVDKLLSDIFSTLNNPDKEMILDFVYGCKNEKGNFEPLDGQQRLTTLFLLHLYAAWGADAPTSSLVFRYSTRDNTSVFCESITDPAKFIYDRNGGRVSEQIKDCAFFRASFQDDPSIMSMLVVLDKIEAKFKDEAADGKLWKQLTQNCRIKFYSLDFGDFGLSDDLYIKMNSRGKGLTDYEIFKSQLEKYIDVTLGEKELMYEVAKKFDTDYTDLVWSEQYYDKKKIDDSFVTLLKNILSIRNFKREKNTQYLKNLKSLGNYIPPKEGEDPKEKPQWYIEKDDIVFIVKFLDTFHRLFPLAEKDPQRRAANDLFWQQIFYQSDSVLGDEQEKVRLFTVDINLFRTACNKLLRNPERVMFYAQYYALSKLSDAELARPFKHEETVSRLRHIRNLVENSDDELSRPDNIAEMLTSVESILDGDIASLTSSKFNANQRQEELAKANSPDRWAALYRFENHDILRGALSLMAPEKEEKSFAIEDDSVFATLTSRLEIIRGIFDDSSKDKDRDRFIRAALLSHADFGQISRSDIKYGRDCHMYGRKYASWRLLLTKNRSFDQTRTLSLIDSIDMTSPLSIQTLPADDWRYYATKKGWYDHTYYSYDYPKYGYFFVKDSSSPLEVYLLQSTSSYDDNVMWKLLNKLLEYTLRERKELTQNQSRLGDRQTAPELHILDKFTLDVRQTGWQIGDTDFLNNIKNALTQKRYTITDGIAIAPAGTDYIEFGVQLFKDIKTLL